jgi:hypothetical protein
VRVNQAAPEESMAGVIAEQKLVAWRPSGARVDVVAAIGRPYLVGPDEWACPAALTGLYEKLHDVHGASSLQSLCLAASLLRQLLTSFVEDGGGRLTHLDGGPFDVAASFSRVGAIGETP